MFQKKLFAKPPFFGELDDGVQISDIEHRFFGLFQHRLFNYVTARYYLAKKKKTVRGDDKTKIVSFEYFIAFISI